MAEDREATPDPDLVTPATNPTPDDAELEDDAEDLESAEQWLGEPKPVDGSGPLP
jgi:hypothetical protein